MVKNKSSFFAKLASFTAFLFRTLEFCLFVGIVALAIFLWQKPQYLNKWLMSDNTTNDSASFDYEKFDTIENKNETLETANKNYDEKIDLIKQNFENLSKSKADNEQIINLSNQINEFRNTAKKLSQISNSGALMLTSAMLIRDNISRGIGCKKESEGLKILSQNIDSVTQDVEFVFSYCNSDFVSENAIIDKFNDIYTKTEKEIQSQKQEQNWKQRLSSKVSEYIKFSNNKNSEYNPLASLLPIKQLVDNKDFSTAIEQLTDSKNSPLMENEDIKNWYEQVQNHLTFYKSLSNIINSSLLIMKVEDAKNITEQNLE